MSPDALAVVRSSWSDVAPDAAGLAEDFYDRLFQLDPSLPGLFTRTDLATQREKLVASLETVIRTLDDPDRLVPLLADLGRRHQAKGVKDRHYDLMGDALLASLRERLGARWTPEAHDAWSEAYTLISSIMKRAGARASGAVAATGR